MIKQQGLRRTVARAHRGIAGARPRYSLDELLQGMRKGDMPKAEGWDDLLPVGREPGVGRASMPLDNTNIDVRH